MVIGSPAPGTYTKHGLLTSTSLARKNTCPTLQILSPQILLLIAKFKFKIYFLSLFVGVYSRLCFGVQTLPCPRVWLLHVRCLPQSLSPHFSEIGSLCERGGGRGSKHNLWDLLFFFHLVCPSKKNWVWPQASFPTELFQRLTFLVFIGVGVRNLDSGFRVFTAVIFPSRQYNVVMAE